MHQSDDNKLTKMFMVYDKIPRLSLWYEDDKYYGLYVNWYDFPAPNKYDRRIVVMFEAD